MEGYIRLHRKIIHNPIFNDFQLYRLWNLCLLNSSYKERDVLIDGQVVKVKPGQWVVGRFSLFDTYNNGLAPKDKVKGEKTPYRWLEKLEKMGYLALEKTNKYTVINVVNWGFYQTDDQPNDQQTDHQMTIKRPSNDQRMTTNKKDKKVKQDKKVKKNKIQYAEFVSLEEEEYKKLISEHGEEKVNQMVKVLDNYKGAKGVTYKSDYRAILNWVVDRVNNSYSSSGQARTGGNKNSGANREDYEEWAKQHDIPF